MADYWISFRIAYDTAEAYDRRYKALEKAIDDCTEYATWKTDTSFVATPSSKWRRGRQRM